MRRILWLSALLALTAISARAEEFGRGFKDALAACKSPCVLQYNLGGYIADFQQARWAVRQRKPELIVIDGLCISSCVILADEVRDHVCITPRARFGFHKAVRDEEVDEMVAGWYVRVARRVRFDPPQSADIHRWVKEHGDYPEADYYKNFLYMPWTDAQTFWRVCTRAEVARARIPYW